MVWYCCIHIVLLLYFITLGGFYFNLHEGIGWSMRAHTRCLSVGFLALMGRFRAGMLHESCIEKAGGQLDLNWLCSSYFHNIRFEPF